MSGRQRTPVDQAQRLAALDPGRSFIVQAPAGSGKTGLLTQRFLRLLPTVDEPEEIVAITFTRKAAAEMKHRILEALAGARGEPPEEAWERQAWDLARAALAHAEARGWRLLENPQRLRLRTIDSLCQGLARQMPLRAGFGDTPGIEEDALPLYRAAASAVLAELEQDSELSRALGVLLAELDNNVEAVHGLLAEMLGRRDQWLDVIGQANARAEVEDALQRVVEGALRELRTLFPQDLVPELLRLARYAAGHLPEDHSLAACAGFDDLPSANCAGLADWHALANWLLTKAGAWRSRMIVSDGFPPGEGEATERKGEIMALLDTLREDEALRVALAGLGRLPAPRYADGEWALLQALFTVLVHAAAQLKVIFGEQGRTDFIEVAAAANAALGEDLEPSDLALRLDYGLRHLLVDEFQDTSHSQNVLLQRLTAGWQPGDGRTLFLVGDPMQSIYRFRKAEVGLFLDAWQGRLGQVPLEPLQLSVNFRSEGGVVDWVNRAFPQVLPARADVRLGAVPYAPAEAFKQSGDGVAVQLHPFIGRDDGAEALRIVELVRAARAERPDGTIAVLVRSKAHLDALIPALREASLRYQAVDIGDLAQRPAVSDLQALTLALLHEGDRVNWLAVLHGPLCGLTLEDLHRLAGTDGVEDSTPLPRLLADEERLAALSADGRARARACAQVLQAALDARGRQPLRDWVEGAWLLLGGPATLRDDASVADAVMFLRLLETLDGGAEPLTPERLREQAAALFAEPDPQAGRGLQLMTIHKAKGLEFDTVILPGLGKSTRGEGRRLLYWDEAAREDGDTDLFFGPVKSSHSAEESRTTAWIKSLEADKGKLETGRLLYVAATRARRRLHLLGHATPKKDGSLSVQSGSLLYPLWPAVQDRWEGEADRCAGTGADQALVEPGAQPVPPEPPPRWRLPSGWVCPEPPASLAVAGEAPEAVEGVLYEWAGDAARAVGTVVHRWLQRLVEAPAADPGALPAFEETTRRLLLREGIPRARLEPAARRVRAALEATLADARGRWLLSGDHADSRCEVPLTAVLDGRLRHLVVDRSFIDADGTRWIVDYKTGTHEGGDVEGFLDQEQERYRDQLQRYAAAYRLLEDRPVRMALFYPLVRGGWREL